MSWSANHPSVSGENADSRSATERDSLKRLTSPYLTVEQAADYLCVSKNYLDKLRVSGMGPPFIRLGRRKVLYRTSDLDRWVEERIYASTSQYEF